MGMSVAALAEKSGVSYATIASIESSNIRRPVRERTVHKLVAALGLSRVEDLELPDGLSRYNGQRTGRPLPRRRRGPVESRSLRWWREKRGMSMSILSKKARVSIDTIWNIENDYTGYSVNEHTARQLVDALGLENIDDVKWPRGVSCKGRAPRASVNGGRATVAGTKVRIRLDTCSKCFLVKSSSGTCGCD